MTTATTRVPAYIARWSDEVPPLLLAEAVPDPSRAALFSADMVAGFCSRGNLASERVGALATLVAALFRRAYRHGIRHFVLLQGTHHPQTPEFDAFPPHCVRGTEEATTIPQLRELPFSGLFTIIEKNSLHPALGTGFDRWLDEHPEVHTGLVVGDCTDLCVYQLAMHLRLRANALNLAGFQVFVSARAVDTYHLPEKTAGKLGTLAHPGDFFHQVFLYHFVPQRDSGGVGVDLAVEGAGDGKGTTTRQVPRRAAGDGHRGRPGCTL